MDPNIEFYESDSTPLGDGTIIDDSNPISFGLVYRGLASFPTGKEQIHLWNDKGGILGCDDAENVTLNAVPVTGSMNHPIFSGTAFNGYQPMLEARSLGSFGVASDAQEYWTPIGPAAFLPIGDIPSNCMRVIELRLNVPADAPTVALNDFALQINM